MPHTLRHHTPVRSLVLCLAAALLLSLTPVVRADIVELNDGNLIEGKLINIEQEFSLDFGTAEVKEIRVLKLRPQHAAAAAAAAAAAEAGSA